MKTTTIATMIGALFLASPAMAGSVWLTAWDNETGNTRLLGFDEETGVQHHSIQGEGIIAADVCDKTGTVYYLDLFTLKAVDVDGNVRVIEENIGHNFSGNVQVKVGQHDCTVWAYALWNQDMHIIRNPGDPDQFRIDTVAFDYIAAADIDDSNDDLWIGQANGRVYRVSKKTGLRSYRIAPVGGYIESMAVGGGIVHVLRNDGLTGYLNTTRREAPQQLYFDTSYQSMFDATATFSAARVYTNSLGEPIVNALNLYYNDGYRYSSEVARMEIDTENGTLLPTNDRFIPFADQEALLHGHGEFTMANGRNMWMFNQEKMRMVDANGTTLREIDYEQNHADLMAYYIAY